MLSCFQQRHFHRLVESVHTPPQAWVLLGCISVIVFVAFTATMFAIVRAFLRLSAVAAPGNLWTKAATTRESSAQSTTTTPTTHAVTAPPITEPRVPHSSLICTIGDHLSTKNNALPPDGVCTIIFYDSLYKPGGSTLSEPFEPNFQRFLDATDAHNLTQFGIGFDYRLRKNTAVIVNDTVEKSQLDSLWQRRIYHYGHVNTPAFGVGLSDMADLINSARTVASLMRDKDINERPVYTAVVLPVLDAPIAEFIVKKLRNAVVDILIGLAHQAAEDKMNPNCLMMPPSFMDSPSNDYPFSLRLWHETFQTIAEARLPTTLALSVGIALRRYRPRYPDPYVEGDSEPRNYSIMHRCTSFEGPQLADVLEVCQNTERNFTWHAAIMSEFTFDKNGSWLFTNDGTRSLRYKLCEAKKDYASLKYTIAAMDIDFSDARFDKLYLLRNLTLCFQNTYNITDVVECCENFDYSPPCHEYHE
ncbi:hypothetical protein V5799_019066 [Amblyomma americanum]|uniref:Uncharacterized protein n=1 Tax=Amblyomma americanum TaxID=6943 RepID=A0AAQ4EYT1_AMBAM